MLYQGKALTVSMLEDGIAELNFDLEGESVNKFNQLTLSELNEAGKLLSQSDAKGLLVTSSKSTFIVGADITEFDKIFGGEKEEMVANVLKVNDYFNQIEDLPFPTLVAINGYALGGGFEMCMSCDFRVMSTAAKVGLPEVKLGIYPGFGGTVRLPRMIGVDNAAEWIATGKEQRAQAALKVGAVDAIVAPEKLREASLKVLRQAVAGDLDYKQRRIDKTSPLKLNDIEGMMSFFTVKAMIKQQAGRNYPAPVEAVNTMEKSWKLDRTGALIHEANGFYDLISTPQARAMTGLFLGDQFVSKKAKKIAKGASSSVDRAAVLGAGIMGGGIAYQSAYKGTPIIMKDINQAGIDLGLSEANTLLAKRVDRKRMTPAKMGEVLAKIQPQLSYDQFDSVDVVVEAVVENPKVKHAVLAECEAHLRDGAVLASNTSTISIDYLAKAVSRPENFCGMHFFNPVHRMPLVEVIRGEKTSDETVAKVVDYANKLGKKAVVINDCPGFFVNRVLFPYFGGFAIMLQEGVDFAAIDKVMERFGWPMGPAYLGDVVGLDTAAHCADVLAEGFPERMAKMPNNATDVLFKAGRLGQKNDLGFYKYELDKKGRQKKVLDPSVYDLLAPYCGERKELDAEEIIARMMIPMVNETQRCLEEGIIGSATEADMALIYGVGFPPFRGGVFRWVDEMGMAKFVELADKYAHLGKLYEVTAKQREMAANNAKYY